MCPSGSIGRRWLFRLQLRSPFLALVQQLQALDGCGAAAAAATAGALQEKHSFLVDLEFFNESYWEVGHNTASSLTEGIGDQASGWVDVPGGVSQPAERLGHSGRQEKNFLYQDENCKFPLCFSGPWMVVPKYFKYMGMRKSHK